MIDEIEKIKSVYNNRIEGSIYNYTNPEVLYEIYSKHKIISRYFSEKNLTSKFNNLRLLDVGSGFGDSIIEFVRMGFSPENIAGVELMENRFVASKQRLPLQINLINSNFLDCKTLEKFDVIYVSLVFTSLLTNSMRIEFANKIKSLLSEGGVVIVYDFTINNPKNKDVRKLTLSEIIVLFNGRGVVSYRTTIIPPIGRFVAKYAPNLLPFFSFLTSHRLTFIS